MSIGDVNSNERGSGARYNDGKPAMELIPLQIIADSFAYLAPTHLQADAMHSLYDLGTFQITGNVDSLVDALEGLADYWRECAAVFAYGRKKYASWNWAKGMAWSVPLACAARHALAILEGEDNDLESGLPHVGHFLANLVMLRHFVRAFPEGNDLPPAELFTPPPASRGFTPSIFFGTEALIRN